MKTVENKTENKNTPKIDTNKIGNETELKKILNYFSDPKTPSTEVKNLPLDPIYQAIVKYSNGTRKNNELMYKTIFEKKYFSNQ